MWGLHLIPNSCIAASGNPLRGKRGVVIIVQAGSLQGDREIIRISYWLILVGGGGWVGISLFAQTVAVSSHKPCLATKESPVLFPRCILNLPPPPQQATQKNFPRYFLVFLSPLTCLAIFILDYQLLINSTTRMHNPSLSSACDSISDIWLTLIISWKLLDFLLFCGFYLRGSHDLNAWRAQRTRSRGRRGSSSFFNIISKRIWPFPSWSVLLAAWRGFLAHFGTVWLWYCTTGTVPGSVPGTVPLVLWLLYCIWYCDWYFTTSTVPGTVDFGTVPLVLWLWYCIGEAFWRPLWLWYCAWYCAWYCITLVLHYIGGALVLYHWYCALFCTSGGTLVLYLVLCLVLWYCTIGEAFWRPLWQLNQPPLSPLLHSPAGIHGAAYFTNI